MGFKPDFADRRAAAFWIPAFAGMTGVARA